jgi:hypothetical protein
VEWTGGGQKISIGPRLKLLLKVGYAESATAAPPYLAIFDSLCKDVGASDAVEGEAEGEESSESP